MFVDVQQKALYWLLAAWDGSFNGYVLDYGTWPDQQRVYFTLRDIQKTLATAIPNSGLEGAIYGGLEKLCDERLNRSYYREDGVEMRVNQCLIDSNWGQSTDVVYQFCRQSQHAGILFPSHGKYVGASSIPFAEYAKKRGDRIGHHWRVPNTAGKRQVRHVLIDTNYWKSFIHARFGVNMGDPGCLSLFGHDPKLHTMLAEHLVAEYRVQASANGRTVDEWKIRPSHPDNHWFDCMVGCAVGASMLGVELGTLKTIAKPQRQRVKLSDMRK
jgi:phage terminase large subunit GpA-like protein